jgi:uncharacterized Zn finger protein
MHRDGNAIAGMLEEIFTVDVTTAMRTCQSCGEERAIGSHRLYQSAGYVLRCPNCGDMAATIATVPGDYQVSLFGSWSVELPA